MGVSTAAMIAVEFLDPLGGDQLEREVPVRDSGGAQGCADGPAQVFRHVREVRPPAQAWAPLPDSGGRSSRAGRTSRSAWRP